MKVKKGAVFVSLQNTMPLEREGCNIHKRMVFFTENKGIGSFEELVMLTTCNEREREASQKKKKKKKKKKTLTDNPAASKYFHASAFRASGEIIEACFN